MILLDTYTLLRLVSDPSQLSANAASLMSDPTQLLAVSAISAFEIGILSEKKRIHLGSAPEIWFGEAIKAYAIDVIPVSWEIAVRSSQLPAIHGDPMDRIILASAIIANMPIVSPDRHFASYPNVRVVW